MKKKGDRGEKSHFPTLQANDDDKKNMTRSKKSQFFKSRHRRF